MHKTIKYFVVVAGVSLILLGLIMLTSPWFDDLLLALISCWKGKPPLPHWLSMLHRAGIEALMLGIVVVAIGWFALPRWTPMVSLASKDSFLLVTFILAIVVLWLPPVLIGHSAVIGSERYWWLKDDAMISMRYARNFANGLGLVWNSGGDKVEGYTNFLWTSYMALVHLFPIPASKTSLVILITNIILATAVVPIVIGLIRHLRGGPLVTALTLASCLFNKNMMFWTTEGFETPLLTVLFLLTTYRVIKEADQRKPNLLTFLLIASMSLVRSDALILSGLLYALSVLLSNHKRLTVLYSVLSLMLPIAHEVFRLSYYGDPVPNTAYLKVFNWDGRYTAGWKYVLDFAKHYPIAIGFAIVGSLLSLQKVRLYLLAIIVLYSAYVAYVGGDFFQNYRFFVPVLPLMLTLAFLGVQSLELTRVIGLLRRIFEPRSFQTAIILALLFCGITIIVVSLVTHFMSIGPQSVFGSRKLLSIIVGLTLLVAALTFSHWKDVSNCLLRQMTSFKLAIALMCFMTTPLLIPGYGEFLVPFAADTGNIRIGLLLKQNTPPNSKVADFWAGSVFYFSERYAIDLLGKSDRHVAHLTVTSNGMKPGHNKYDFDYSLGTLKPDFVVANFRLPVQEDEMLQLATGDLGFTGQLYFNRVFQEHCLRCPVTVETWRTIFACDWSSNIRHKKSEQ